MPSRVSKCNLALLMARDYLQSDWLRHNVEHELESPTKYTMIHHKKETTSNPKNPRRKPLVDRWKFKDFVEKQKWMEDGLNVSLKK